MWIAVAGTLLLLIVTTGSARAESVSVEYSAATLDSHTALAALSAADAALSDVFGDLEHLVTSRGDVFHELDCLRAAVPECWLRLLSDTTLPYIP